MEERRGEKSGLEWSGGEERGGGGVVILIKNGFQRALSSGRPVGPAWHCRVNKLIGYEVRQSQSGRDCGWLGVRDVRGFII